MLKDIFLAVVQSATEFLPVSSSGHLALFSNLFSRPNIFFFTVLHFASLLAVAIFMREEIKKLFSFKKESLRMWSYVVIAITPAALFGLVFREKVERAFSSFLFLGCAFLFTGFILFLSRFAKERTDLNAKTALLIGLFQILALFPGVSRSGMTIASALLLGVKKEKAARFSFLMFIPLALGALILEGKEGFYLDFSLVISFLMCLFLSILFLKLLFFMVKKGRFWSFAPYCFLVGSLSLYLYWSGYRF